MSELPWFKFSPSEWLSGDIQLVSLECQGFFVNLCCIYWKKRGSIAIAQLLSRYSTAKEMLKELEGMGIVKILHGPDEFISIAFIDEQLDTMAVAHDRKVKAGRLGAAKRWQSHSTPNGNKEEEEDIEKEREIDDPAAPLCIDILRLHCYVGEGEAVAFTTLFDPFTRAQGMKVIDILTDKRNKNGFPSRPCLSDLVPYIKKNIKKIKER